MIDIPLKYKGARTYLQGGDFFQVIAGALSPRFPGHIARLAFKCIARNQCQLLLEKPVDAGRIVGNGIWRTDEGQTHPFWLRETSSPVTDRYPFDEEAIVNPACVAEAGILGTRANDYSVIENVVALTKRLNYTLSPDIDGKWLFGQIDLTAGFPSNWEEIRIERTAIVGGSFSRNSIEIDGARYGEIRFIVGHL